MHDPIVHTIDLNFHDRSGAIASYLVPHHLGAILVDPGPGSTIPNLISEIKNYGFEVRNITDVLLTHIHLDHAGASGWFAKQGTRIHVHPNGAPHIMNPGKLMASAARIYGDQMDLLWGEFLPVQEGQIHIVQDGETFRCGDLTIRAMEVPGHATHHNAYFIGDICFCGDVGGIRVNGLRYLSIPTPPPEFHLEQWRDSIRRIQDLRPIRIAPTHFGVYEDAEWHLEEMNRGLDRIEQWMEENMPMDLPIETLRSLYVNYEIKRAESAGLSQIDAEVQQIANPSFMSADGMKRYWKKYRTAAA